MKVQTIKLEGAALDWAVAVCEGFTDYDPLTEKMLPPRKEFGWVSLCDYCWSTDWAQAGPIIERERIKVTPNLNESWLGQIRHTQSHPLVGHPVLAGWTTKHGPTLLIAAMRCYVASKLGDEVEIPEELL